MEISEIAAELRPAARRMARVQRVPLQRAWVRRLAAAGVDTTFEVVPGAPHGFEAWAPATATARSFVTGAQEWLRLAVRQRSPRQAHRGNGRPMFA